MDRWGNVTQIDNLQYCSAQRQPALRAKKDGSWPGEDKEIRRIVNLWLKGNFSPEDDEITEEKAMAYLDGWRKNGTWPSRE